MERLTERELYNGRVCFAKCSKTICKDKCVYCEIPKKARQKLKYYEDLEEQGLLLKLPCKVGDTVYELFLKNDNPKYYECEVGQFIIHSDVVEMNVLIKLQNIRSRLKAEDFGKTVFLTQSEADKALREMKGGK